MTWETWLVILLLPGILWFEIFSSVRDKWKRRNKVNDRPSPSSAASDALSRCVSATSADPTWAAGFAETGSAMLRREVWIDPEGVPHYTVRGRNVPATAAADVIIPIQDREPYPRSDDPPCPNCGEEEGLMCKLCSTAHTGYPPCPDCGGVIEWPSWRRRRDVPGARECVCGSRFYDTGYGRNFAVSLWETGLDPAGTPAAAYLNVRLHRAWSGPPPPSVRWLPREAWPAGGPQPPREAAGAVLFALTAPASGKLRAVQIEGLDRAGDRLPNDLPHRWRWRGVVGLPCGAVFEAGGPEDPTVVEGLALAEDELSALALRLLMPGWRVRGVGVSMDNRDAMYGVPARWPVHLDASSPVGERCALTFALTVERSVTVEHDDRPPVDRLAEKTRRAPGGAGP